MISVQCLAGFHPDSLLIPLSLIYDSRHLYEKSDRVKVLNYPLYCGEGPSRNWKGKQDSHLLLTLITSHLDFVVAWLNHDNITLLMTQSGP